jgi:hypothetical protein
VEEMRHYFVDTAAVPSEHRMTDLEYRSVRPVADHDGKFQCKICGVVQGKRNCVRHFCPLNNEEQAEYHGNLQAVDVRAWHVVRDANQMCNRRQSCMKFTVAYKEFESILQQHTAQAVEYFESEAAAASSCVDDQADVLMDTQVYSTHYMFLEGDHSNN